MVSIHTDDIRRTTKRVGKQAKRASRQARVLASDVAERTAHGARRATRATVRSMREHPIAWTSAALGATAAVAGLLLWRRSA